jgi:hypothetical protein
MHNARSHGWNPRARIEQPLPWGILSHNETTMTKIAYFDLAEAERLFAKPAPIPSAYDAEVVRQQLNYQKLKAERLARAREASNPST